MNVNCLLENFVSHDQSFGKCNYTFWHIDILALRMSDCAVFGQINLKKLSKNVAKLENWNCKVIVFRIQFCQVFVV